MHTVPRHTVVDSPLGPVTLVDLAGNLGGLYLCAPDPARHGHRDDSILPAAREQVAAYFAGDLRTFDLPLTMVGTAFQRRVWAELLAIPYGETRSYLQVARRIGLPEAVRAVGLANGRNPVSIVVPCHRVIGSDGSLTGYGWGLDRKRWLLDLESPARQLMF